MKKFWTAVVAVLLCCALLAGCGGSSGQTQQDAGDATSGQTDETQGVTQQPDAPVYGSDGAQALALLPIDDEAYAWFNDAPVPDCIDADLQALYKAARWLTNVYRVGGLNAGLDFQDTVTAGEYNWEYYRDNSFADYAAFETAVKAVFTPECAERFLDVDSILCADNGGLYCLDGGMGSDIFYIGEEFELVSEAADEVVVNDNAIFNAELPEVYPDEPDPAKNEIKPFQIVFKLTDAGWRVDAFTLPTYSITL